MHAYSFFRTYHLYMGTTCKLNQGWSGAGSWQFKEMWGIKKHFFCTVYFVTQMIDSFHSFPKRFYFLFTSLRNFDWWALENFTMGSTLGSKHWLLPGSNPGFVCLSSALCGMSQLHIIEHLYVLKHWYVQVSTMSSESSCWDNSAHPVHALLMLSCCRRMVPGQPSEPEVIVWLVYGQP